MFPWNLGVLYTQCSICWCCSSHCCWSEFLNMLHCVKKRQLLILFSQLYILFALLLFWQTPRFPQVDRQCPPVGKKSPLCSFVCDKINEGKLCMNKNTRAQHAVSLQCSPCAAVSAHGLHLYISSASSAAATRETMWTEGPKRILGSSFIWALDYSNP